MVVKQLHLEKIISRRYVFSMVLKKKQMGIYKIFDFLTWLYHTSATSSYLEGLDIARVSFCKVEWKVESSFFIL